VQRPKLSQHPSQVRGGPAATKLRRVKKVSVLGLDHHGRGGNGREVGEMLMRRLHGPHIGEQIVEALSLHHRLQAVAIEQSIVADRKLAARHVGPGKRQG
jgi:hypothetical protein